jgi:ATP/maltotriose-dependent transcriptional regulator MalT
LTLLSAPAGFGNILTGAYEVLSRVCIAQGDLTGAEQAVRELEHLNQSAGIPLFRPWITSGWAHLWLAQGNLTQAADWAEHTLYHQDALEYPLRPVLASYAIQYSLRLQASSTRK